VLASLCHGVIGAAGIGMLEPDFSTNFKEANKRALRKEIRKAKQMTKGIIGVKEIRKAKQMTKGIIGVNIMVALSDYDELSLVAVEEGADLIFLGAGLPLKIPKTLLSDKLRDVSTKAVPIVSSARAAKIIFQYWARNYNHVPDAVIVEGPLAGGHLGLKRKQIDDSNYTLVNILSEVISVIRVFEEQFKKKIPVIAAGGIYTGEDIYKFIQMGADGVQMATRFVPTHECDADIKFKEAYTQVRKRDIIIINSPVGMPGRAIRNKFLDEVEAGIRKPFKCPWKCLKTCDFKKAPYCIALALTNAKKGYLEEGFAFAGANAYRVDKIISVKELIETLLIEYERAAPI